MTATNKVTLMSQRLQDQTVFSFTATGATFTPVVRSSVCVFFCVFMSVGAVGSVCIVVAASVNNIFHVVGLGSAFKVVGVAASAVVAFVAYHWRCLVCGDVVRESVD
jgi:hypothetical protein